MAYSLSEFDDGDRRPSQDNQPVRPATTIPERRDARTKSFVSTFQPNYTNTRDNELMTNMRATSLEHDKRHISPGRSLPDKVGEVQQRLDAIWDSAQNRDLTVHLKMDVHEDLTDALEEFHFFERLGDFVSARKHFEEHLADHHHDPYVLVQYCEMLLEQGDYLSVLTKLDSHSLYEPETEHNGSRLLKDYLHLIVFFTGCHYMPRRPKSFSYSKETLRLLEEVVMKNKRDITSTEIKYVALLYNLCGLGHPEVTRKGLTGTLSSSFPRLFHRKLYESLLRQGRIWDLRDIIVARMKTGSPWAISADWSTDSDFHVRLSDLVTQWTMSTAEHDASTLLGLLDILTSFICWDEHGDKTPAILTVGTQIARSIIDCHPEAMKTRPFLQWILVQCESAEMGSHDQLQQQEDHLELSPGILYRRARRNLVQYAPYKTEAPGWVCQEGSPQLQKSARMALKTSIALGDYRTQAKALQQLILMSSSPVKEFEELGKLQNLIQGDNYNFAETLAAKFLISNEDVSRGKLRVELASQWSISGFSSGLSAHELWILSMIRHALARDPIEAKYALGEADTWYKESPPEFVKYVNTRIPRQRNVCQTQDEAPTERQASTEVRSRRRHASFSLSPEPRQYSRGKNYATRVTEDLRREDSDHEGEPLGRMGTGLRAGFSLKRNTRNRTSGPVIIDTRIPGLNTLWPPTASRSPHGPATEFRKLPPERHSTLRDGPLDESDMNRGRSLSRDLRSSDALRPRQQPCNTGDKDINATYPGGSGTQTHSGNGAPSNAECRTDLDRMEIPSRGKRIKRLG
ncbi:hypothetical protein F5Y07DRAFT_350135 [Xylaria sp. FL0933]|nr:hypothetical protein F5Y07DRAFT_350135 [Xylaria sp. FL0933]